MSILLFLLLLVIGGFGLSMGTGTEAVAPRGYDTAIPKWALRQGHPGDASYLAGAHLFAESGCLSCHTYLGSGSSNLGAPELSAEGAKGHTVSWFVAKLRCPSCVTPGSSMPPYQALGPNNLHKVALFLTLSKRGS